MDISEQVTLVMPLFNTMSRVDSSGNPLVTRMLRSVAAQEFGSPRVLALDNRSVDDTVDYVKASVPRGVPLALTVDSQRRTAEEAINLLMQQVSTPYVAVINDDDALSPGFVAELFAVANRTKAVLTYPNARWLGLDGTLAGSLVPTRGRSYGPFRSSERNLRLFLRHRNPVPLIFGLWRTEVAQEVFNVRTLDAHAHDLDNMILATTFAQRHQVEFVNRHLFQYSVRQGHKAPDVVASDDSSSSDPIAAVFGNWAHHIKFSSQLLLSARPRVSQARDNALIDTALVISEELRRRLCRAFPWVLGLALVARPDFDRLNRLRRNTNLRVGLTRELRYTAGHQGRSSMLLREEISKWSQVLGVLEDSAGSLDASKTELIAVAADVRQFMVQLRLVTQ